VVQQIERPHAEAAIVSIVTAGQLSNELRAFWNFASIRGLCRCVSLNSGGAIDQAASLLLHAPFDRSTANMLCLVLEDGWAEIAIGCKRRRVPDKAAA
jgi:hypothetical protein